MKTVRTVVVDALDATVGLRGNPVFAAALVEGRDIRLSELEIDSLTRFEAMMLIEEALGIEIDDDEVLEQETLNGLVAYIEQRVGSARGA